MDPIRHFAAEAHHIARQGFHRVGNLGRQVVRVLGNDDPDLIPIFMVGGFHVMIFSQAFGLMCTNTPTLDAESSCKVKYNFMTGVGGLVMIIGASKIPLIRHFMRLRGMVVP